MYEFVSRFRLVQVLYTRLVRAAMLEGIVMLICVDSNLLISLMRGWTMPSIMEPLSVELTESLCDAILMLWWYVFVLLRMLLLWLLA